MTNSAAISAATTESQMPFMPEQMGQHENGGDLEHQGAQERNNGGYYAVVERGKECRAKDVKPQSRKLREYSFMPRVVSSSSSAS